MAATFWTLIHGLQESSPYQYPGNFCSTPNRRRLETPTEITRQFAWLGPDKPIECNVSSLLYRRVDFKRGNIIYPHSARYTLELP